MPLVTTILRVRDKLPLCGTSDLTPLMKKLSQKAKPVQKNISSHLKRQIIEAGEHYFAYIIERDICMFVICERDYSKKICFTYLREVSRQFNYKYSNEIYKASSPYSFLDFSSDLRNLRKAYLNSSNSSGAERLQRNLEDITGIMRSNLKEIVDRGYSLENLRGQTEEMGRQSDRFKKKAKSIKCNLMYTRVAVPVAVVSSVGILIYFFLL